MSNGGTISLQEARERISVPIFPVPGGRISQQPGPGHTAIDIAAPLGTPVLAPVSGRVTSVRQEQGQPSFGTNVRVQLENGLEAVFAHLNEAFVRVGQAITRGQQVGTVGMTGTGASHLHYEVRQPGPDVFGGAFSTSTAVNPYGAFGQFVQSGGTVRATSSSGQQAAQIISSGSSPRQVATLVDDNPVFAPGTVRAASGRPMTAEQVEQRTDPGIDIGRSIIKAVGLSDGVEGPALTILLLGGGFALVLIAIFILSSGLRAQAGQAALKAVDIAL